MLYIHKSETRMTSKRSKKKIQTHSNKMFKIMLFIATKHVIFRGNPFIRLQKDT